MIKNIIFDIGNVLIDYDPTSYMKGFGFSLEKEKRIKETVFDGPLWQELDRSIMPFEQIRREFAALTTPKDREDLLRVFDSSYQTVHKRDSAIPWIRSMQERGFETYYLSNYSDWMLNLTQDALDFLPLMRGGLFSCEVGLRKPEPEIY
ncbi:MAG: HAD family phosphatase, partial [Clostridiales bacterium]|nr:HAD family phosphatase [Clostridiales bacterium]